MEVLVTTRLKVDLGTMARIGLEMLEAGERGEGDVISPAPFDPARTPMLKKAARAHLSKVAQDAAQDAIDEHVRRANQAYLEGQQQFAAGGLEGEVAGAEFVDPAPRQQTVEDDVEGGEPGLGDADLDAAAGTSG